MRRRLSLMMLQKKGQNVIMRGKEGIMHCSRHIKAPCRENLLEVHFDLMFQRTIISDFTNPTVVPNILHSRFGNMRAPSVVLNLSLEQRPGLRYWGDGL